MEYEEFLEKVIDCIKEMLGETYRICHSHIRKNNNVWLDGIIIKRSRETVCPTVYLDRNYFKAYKEEGIIETAKYILEQYQQALTCNISAELDLSYEYVKPRVIYRLINQEKNEEILKDCPMIPFLDLAVTFHILLNIMPEKEQATIQINNAMMSIWGVTVKELVKLAEENTKRQLPPIIYTLNEMLEKIMHQEIQKYGIEIFQNTHKGFHIEEKNFYMEPVIEQLDKTTENLEIYVLTNKQNIYGATAIIYKDIIMKFSKKFQCDLYLLPSSIHEFIIIPIKYHFKKKELEEMVQLINRTQLSEQEFLSDSVYFYCQKEGKFQKL